MNNKNYKFDINGNKTNLFFFDSIYLHNFTVRKHTDRQLIGEKHEPKTRINITISSEM